MDFAEYPEDSDKNVTAVVLAGGDASDALARHQGVANKAHVIFRGQALAGHVLAALRGSGQVGRIVYVGEPPPELATGPDFTVPSGRRFSDSVAMGLGAALAVAPGSRILLCTADLPWLESGAVDRFLKLAVHDLNYPVVSSEVALREFPDQKRTWVRLKQGKVTGGNLALIAPQVVPDLLKLTDRFFAARKNPLALSSLLGTGTLLALLRGQADLPKLERRMSELLGHAARAIWVQDASLGADLDKPEQLAGY